MKIIHTADWHLGKQLHGHSLYDEQTFFLDWLAERIMNEKTDVLLVSGDVFDTTYPSHQTLAQYYGFLKKLIGTGCRIIITGGNHDSPGVLNAPREILDFLDIKVVGNTTENIEDELVIIKKDNQSVVVAAVPYLRDVDLRKSVSGQNADDRLGAIRQGIAAHYGQLAVLKNEKYANIPSIAMGHLYVNGASVSDSEREIHVIGGEAAFGATYFPVDFDYIALGHIHKPQKIAPHIRYSGSPVPLSFSERNDQKYIIELALTPQNTFDIEVVGVPVYRELRRFTGNLDEVEAALKSYQCDNTLPTFVEILVTEPLADPNKEMYFNELVREYESAPFKIIKTALHFENRTAGADELFLTGTSIQDLTPIDVFNKRIAHENLDETTQMLLTEAFAELYQEFCEG